MSRIIPIHAFLLGIVLPAAALADAPCDKPVIRNNLLNGQRSITFHNSRGAEVYVTITPFFVEIGGRVHTKGSIDKEKLDDPNGFLEGVWSGDASDLESELGKICTDDWVRENLTQVVSGSQALSAHARPSAGATPLPSSGQASQAISAADLNGDGNPDSLVLSSAGLVIRLRAADGTVLSNRTFAAGFSPDIFTSQLVVADFNGDGKIDVAVSNFGQLANFGQPTTNPGGISVLLGSGDGTFGAPHSFPAGPNPISLAAADFNGDGKIDLVVANTGGTVSMLPGNGDGTLGAPSTVVSPGGDPFALQSILAVDLNGDGAPDLALANFAKSISVLLNSNGKFGQPIVTGLPFSPQYLAYSDLNHDGRLDLAAVSKSSNALVILQGKGDGTFQPPASYANGNQPESLGVMPLDDGYTLLITTDAITDATLVTIVSPQGFVFALPYNFVGGQPTAIAAGDLNGDGQPDVVITGASGDVSVMISQGGTRFKAPVGYSLGPGSPQAVAIGDLNGDGKPDVIVANAAGSASVMLGNGDGTLRAATSTAVNPNAQSIALGDFNRDGKLDVAVAAYGSSPGGADSGAVVVLPGKGDGTFQTPVILAAGGLHPEAIAAGDLNGDGTKDLAVVMVGASGQPATLAVFLGQANGTFAAARTFPLKTAGGSQSGIAIGDLNGDGKPDIAAVSNFGQDVDILLGDGAGGFQEAAATPTTDSGPTALLMTDFNGDGKLDLIVPHCCGLSDATFLLGNGNGTFQSEVHFVSGREPAGIALTRFAGSNGPDMVIADRGGTWLSLVNASSSPLTVSAASAGPASGSGTSQTFTFTFSDSSGYQNLKVVDVLINAALDGRQACYLAFTPSGATGGSLFLVDDAGDAGGPYQGMLLPGSGSISNGQCTINGAQSSVSGGGNSLTLTLAITFSASFTGNKVVYLSAQDQSSTNSGWQALGTWGVPFTPSGTIAVVSLVPARVPASGTAQTLTATLTDSKGAADFGVVNLLVNNFIDGRQACYLAYVASTNSLALVDDAGNAAGPFAGSMVLNGAAATIQNSQCSVSGVGSSAAKNGNTLTLALNITFKAPFAGNRVIWVAGRDAADGNNTDWQAVGTAAIP